MENLIRASGLAEEISSANVTTPILFITGAHDLPGIRLDDIRAARRGAFAAAQHIDLPEAGHYPMDETPVALASTINAFLLAHDGLMPGPA